MKAIKRRMGPVKLKSKKQEKQKVRKEELLTELKGKDNAETHTKPKTAELHVKDCITMQTKEGKLVRNLSQKAKKVLSQKPQLREVQKLHLEEKGNQ